MARELLFSGSNPWCAPLAPAASSMAVLGAVQQLQQPCAVVSSSSDPCDPSEMREVWCVEGSSSSSSTHGGSPVESLAGCNGTESDEDECDYIAGLAEQIAHSMLDDDERSEEISNGVTWTSEQIKVPSWNGQIGLSASPQSTLTGLEWSGPKRSTSISVGSSNGSSKRNSRISSPNSTALDNAENAWELLYAAAGEVAKLTYSEERRAFAPIPLPSRPAVGSGSFVEATQKGRHSPASKQFVVSSYSTPSSGVSLKELSLPSRSIEASGTGLCCYRDKPSSALPTNLQRGGRSKARDEERSITGQNFRAPKSGNLSSPGCRGGARHRVLAPSNNGRHRGGVGNAHRAPLGATDLLSSHHFPPLGQQHPFLSGNGCGSTAGSGMRAVFLGSAGSRESGGTGVFLPRRIGCGSESKKKPACSTVLLPSRIVEALNLNMEGVVAGPASPPLVTASQKGLPSTASLRSTVEPFVPTASAGCVFREERSESRWTTSRPACSPLLQEVTPEINLPTEWTY